MAAELRSKPNSVQVVDNPWHHPGEDTAELCVVEINRAGFVVRAVYMPLSGGRPSLQAAIDEAAARHTSEEAVLGEWMASDPESGARAALLVIGLARGRGLAPDQAWHGRPQRGLTAPIPDYPPRVERWGHVVDYDSGRDERWDWTRACDSIEEARELFQRSAHE